MKLKNRMIAALVIILTLILFVSCGKEKTKSNTEIGDDICANDKTISRYNLVMESGEVIKRQTNVESKEDLVWATAKNSNDDFYYEADYYLRYVKYNDGWILDNFKVENKKYTPKIEANTVTTEMADEVIRTLDYDFWECTDRTEDNDKVTFTYSGYKNVYGLVTWYETIVDYRFSPSELWYACQPDVHVKDIEFDLLGEWTFRDSESDYYVNIHNIDLENGDITLEYNCKNVKGARVIDTGEKININSNGIVTKDFHKNDWMDSIGGKRSIECEGCYIRVVVGELETREGNGESYGISIGDYWLTRN